MTHKLAFIGFGTVGQGLAEILRDKKDELKKNYGFEYSIVAISDFKLGSVFNPSGICPDGVLKAVKEKGSVEGYPEGQKGWDALKTIRECGADTICEATYTDIKTGEPAISHVKAAFESGMNVVTTNKGPVALAYSELKKMADEKGVQFKIEGTVLSGTPSINLAMKTLAGCDIREIKGIMNGTTNYILSEMEKGKEYSSVLKTAQELGYAEADPTADVEGYDAMAKVMILSSVFMGEGLKPGGIERQGITGISLGDIEKAKSEGSRWKLIGSARKENGKVVGSVTPVKLPLTNPLAGVMGATNALTFTTDLMGDVTIVGAGAGKIETGFSMLVDILDIHNSKSCCR